MYLHKLQYKTVTVVQYDYLGDFSQWVSCTSSWHEARNMWSYSIDCTWHRTRWLAVRRHFRRACPNVHQLWCIYTLYQHRRTTRSRANNAPSALLKRNAQNVRYVEVLLWWGFTMVRFYCMLTDHDTINNSGSCSAAPYILHSFLRVYYHRVL